MSFHLSYEHGKHKETPVVDPQIPTPDQIPAEPVGIVGTVGAAAVPTRPVATLFLSAEEISNVADLKDALVERAAAARQEAAAALAAAQRAFDAATAELEGHQSSLASLRAAQERAYAGERIAVTIG